jgi:(1->4)-alpha-D-glucan 1-alpha-D-glucosylmutase
MTAVTGHADGTEAAARRVLASFAPPVSTYRVQLRPGFGFADVLALVPYLDALGVGALYLSPCLRARAGSTHGYDVVDYGTLDPALGTPADFVALATALRARDMGLVLDVVPNHMAADPAGNAWWREVLTHGPAARAADFFDIDWQPVTPLLAGKVLLPILGDHFGRVLERGEIRLAIQDGAVVVRHFEHDLPVDPATLAPLLDAAAARLGERPEGAAPAAALAGLAARLDQLPATHARSEARREARRTQAAAAVDDLRRLLTTSVEAATALAEAVHVVNGTPGEAASFDALEALLERQSYRLSYWRSAVDEINYRRFFDVNELVAVRMERPEVFEAAHQLLLSFVGAGHVTGLRVDHPDGLLEPAAYFARLQAAAWAARAASLCAPGEAAAVVAWREARLAADPADPVVRPLFVVAEKIVSAGEPFPAEWAMHGGTGYRFLNDVNGVLVDRAGLARLEAFWRRLSGESRPFDDIAYESRRLIATSSMASELNVLAHGLADLASRHRQTRDFTLNSLRKVLRDVMAGFPVYRTYVSAAGATAQDRRVVEAAVAAASARNPVMEASIFDFVRDALLAVPDPVDTWPRRLAFAMKAQQVTGPVQAKGLEDTAFYRHVPLLAITEVGSHPAAPTARPEEFHARNSARQRRTPLTLTAVETHDTKRSADARARLAVLSEMPDAWRRAVGGWMRANARRRGRAGGMVAPDGVDEYHFYQALLAIWPVEPATAPLPVRLDDALVDRLAGYMTKAVREAKVRSSWLRPDEAYEAAMAGFVRGVLAAPRFLASFAAFARRVAALGAVNGLAQLVWQVAAPGVPDVYQGAEDWRLSLVDPDNRRPVDFDRAVRRLAVLEPMLARAAAGDPGVADVVAGLVERWWDGDVKLWVLASVLRARRRDGELFLAGDYVGLAGSEPATPVVAFARRIGQRATVVAAARQPARLGAGAWPVAADWGSHAVEWPDTPRGGAWWDVLTGRRLDAPLPPGRLRLADLFAVLPVAWCEWRPTA